MTPVKGLPFMDAESSAALDRRLMSGEIGYKLEQLMELAGQACAHGIDSLYPAGAIVIAVGPGNNGGDGLVAARHLAMMGRDVRVIIPAPAHGKFPYLELQCTAHGVPIYENRPDDGFDAFLGHADVLVDAIFGFSFKPRGEKGVTGVFADLIARMNESGKPIVSIDVPSGWDVDKGDVKPEYTSIKCPAAVISLSAPKLCMKTAHEQGTITHLIGGRFVPDGIWKEMKLDGIAYEGTQLFRRVA